MNEKKAASLLGKFNISIERGFLPHVDPLRVLPEKFQAWEEVAKQLPKLLVASSLRRTVAALPPFPVQELRTTGEIQRAMVMLSFIGHGYVFGEHPTATSIPERLAGPWHEVATKVGRPPVLSYESYALDNWYRINPQGPIEIGNIALIQNFLGGVDEEWFVIIHVDIEAKAAGLIRGVADGISSVEQNSPDDLGRALVSIETSLGSMYQVLARMPEQCDPYIYFNRVRPYIHGWKNHPALPKGLLYEGVSAYGADPQLFRGETGAQSTIVPVADAFLGIVHEQDLLRTYLMEMRQYMPKQHVAFLEAVENSTSVRKYIAEKAPQLKGTFNACVTWLERFRSKHLEYAVSYIAKQAQRDEANPSQVGTGGTPFVSYLTKHRDETSKQLL